MVYDFSGMRDQCYDMYIIQNKTLDVIQEHFQREGFNPSKRAYQCRFKEWGFPPKHVRQHDDQNLQDRIKQLWEKNCTNKQMLNILNSEGYDVKLRELSKLRMKDGLLLRAGNGKGTKRKRKNSTEAQEEDGVPHGEEVSAEEQEETPSSRDPPLPLEIVVKRQARQAKLMAESAERLRKGTRRRRTKGWAGLGPDVGLPPRFPSELTLEESKALLGLNRDMYRELRDVFMEICQANGVVKKTSCRPEQWQFVKEELIARLPHLQRIFRAPNADLLDPTKEPMAFDLICMDVTKRLRTAGKYTSLIEAKNILDLTPDDARDVRAAFDAILRADYFTGKLDVTKEHWQHLKQRWVQETPRLQREFLGIDSQDIWNQKKGALESIARDVQKRNRDSQTKKDPTVANGRKNPLGSLAKTKKTKAAKERAKKTREDGSKGAEQALVHVPSNDDGSSGRSPWMPSRINRDTSGIAALASQALSNEPSYNGEDYSNYQIDPSLLEAASLPQQQHNYYHQPFPPSQQALPGPGVISIYIRPAPATALRYQHIPKVWLETLHPPHTVANLGRVISRKPGLGQITKIAGLADGRTVENDVGSKWAIDEDDELEAYLEHVQGRKATFVIETA